MSVRDSAFGSKSEERGYHSIEHTWGEDYAIHPAPARNRGGSGETAAAP